MDETPSDGQEPTFDLVVSELAEVRRAYEDATDSHERIQLGERLKALRVEAQAVREFVDAGSRVTQLRREAEHIRRQLGELDSGRLSPTRIAFSRGLSGGFDRWQVDEINAHRDRLSGRKHLESRLRSIEAELERREASSAQSPR